MNSHSTEPFLIGLVVVITATVGYFLLRNTGNNAAQKSQKIITGFLGAFLLMGGTVKFFEPFTTMFANQFALSGLPFPTLSNWAGQLGEITAGVALLALLLLGKKLSPVITDKASHLANLLIVFIMVVAIYVHLHPDVPAETLPLGTKPPFLTVFILLLAGLNIYLYRKNQRATRRSSGNP